MSELSDTLFSGLIDEAFKNLTGEERLAFVERLFAKVPTESQERLMRSLVGDLAAESGRPGPDPGIEHQPLSLPMRAERRDLPPRDIGPWRTCCRMMAEVDRASRLDGLDADRPARVFGALGDETRVRIIKLLSEGEERVDDLTRTLDTPQSTVSHHLRVLKEAGLVHAEKRGRSIYYSIAPSED
jgi:DNA-binding HxlR family transcriptional regulator